MSSNQENQKVKIYLDWLSQPCRAVVIVCNLGKIDYEIIKMNVMKGDQFKKEFVSLNPTKKVPFVIDTNGQELIESHNIMRYLCETRNLSQNLYPSKNMSQKAKVDAYLDWHHMNLRLPASRHLLGKMTGKQAQAEEMGSLLAKNLKFFESFWLKEGKFIGGIDTMTIADISAYCELIELLLIGFDFSQYKLISKWMESIKKIEEVQQAHTIFYKVLKNTKPANL